ncbi:acyl-CoA dehydrogenase family protein [Microbacterium sp. NC79]|uniref:acyl-CoA dehydrogenase family protein n=1 Tax=Microbacterium sp. NC79 TaxID=2851009 RepID=UPI001C2C88B7|nr:acyl-CoA dehydrogenase family protein [Microbacterium sp. NC79]MBV0895399.1 acyl-CoA/acyl-ACP dehydrogenase [Microbacterium sp. NC79]
MTFDAEAFLPDDLIARIRERAPRIDAENRFPDEDLAELAAAGYLKILVPTDRGGAGLTLEQAAVLQQRLATAAPATALAINMHLVWTGVAKIMRDRGFDELAFVQEGAARGEVFAFGISEAGNDLVLGGSDTVATPTADGGYAFTGTKIFTSLAPVWTQLGLHGLDSTDPDNPRLVYAFIDRTDAVVTRDDWDTMGMRGTQSRTTELHGAVASPAHVARVVPLGEPDPIMFGIFAAFEILLASVYTGIARRAIDVAVETVGKRRSKKTGKTYAHDADIRWRIADMGLAYDALLPQIAMIARDVDDRVDHGSLWFAKLSGVKHRAVVMAKQVVDEAMLTGGGSSYFARSELQRLYRDVLAGMFHPSDPESAHATMAAAWLGALED